MLRFIAPDDAGQAAHLLIDEFGSLAAVLCAPPEAVERLAGEGVPLFLSALQAALEHALRHRIAQAPILGHSEAVLDYLRLSMSNLPSEQLRVLFLNARNMLIRDEVVAVGDIDQVQIAPRQIVKRALELGATSLVLAHNHPSGDHAPSPADRKWTKAVAQAAEVVGIGVHDHVIVSSQGASSLRLMGFM